MYTAECVTPCHPDKICDQISDMILDMCLEQDPYSRVAVETMGGHGKIVLMGEVTTKAKVNYELIANKVYYTLTGKDIEVTSHIVSQAPEIAQGVDRGGAGDQGIMVGYATMESHSFLPEELDLARNILKPFFEVDGKCQVTIDDDKVTDVVLSVQGKTQKELQDYLRDLLIVGEANIFCNNTGSFEVGGFDSDSGVTGRKIVVDAYGPRVPVGGGAFSGKDPTKVDRSGAYMARWIALNLMYQYNAKQVLVNLAYVIGGVDPVMKQAWVDGRPVEVKYDCRPQAIIERFDLRKPIYYQTAHAGHFGVNSYPWEEFDI